MHHDLAFLHTANVHVETFSKITQEVNPDMRVRHVVAEELLEEARKHGITEKLAQRVHAAVADAASSGARVVACTCSTIGGLAEATEGEFHAMRIDRAMADFAVRQGRRILVAAALESTLEPTLDLLRDSARVAGTENQMTTLLIERAWAFFERGDSEGYIDAIAHAIRTGSHGCDVVVLAQASMAPAAARCGNLGIPVLSSPRMGVEAAVKAVLPVAKSSNAA